MSQQDFLDIIKEAQSSAVRELFETLSHWEKTHLKLLSDIDKELRERIWHDTNYWPVI